MISYKECSEPTMVLKLKVPKPITALANLNNNIIISGCERGSITVWSKKGRRPLGMLEGAHSRSVLSLMPLDVAGESFISHGRDGAISIWSTVKAFTVKSRIACKDQGFCKVELIEGINSVLAMPTGLCGEVELVNFETNRIIATLMSPANCGAVFCIKSLSNGQFIVGYENGSIALWDLKQLKQWKALITEAKTTSEEVAAKRFKSLRDAQKLHNGNLFTENFKYEVTKPPVILRDDTNPNSTPSKAGDGAKVSYPTQQINAISKLGIYEEPMFSCDAYRNGGDVIGCTGSACNKIMTFDIRNGTMALRRHISIPNEGISSVRYRQDGKIVVTGGWDGRIRYFSTKTMKPLAVLDLHVKTVNCLTFDSNNILMSGGADGMICLWNAYSK